MKRATVPRKLNPTIPRAAGKIRHQSRWLEKTSWILSLLAAATVAGVLLFILWIEPHRAVAEIKHVDGTVTKLTTRAFQTRLGIERTRSINLQKSTAAKSRRSPEEYFEPDYRPLATLSFAAGVIDRLTREIVIEEEAGRRGLSVNEDEIDFVIARAYDLVPLPADPAAPSHRSAATWLETKPELRDLVRKTRVEAQQRLERDGLSQDYRKIVRLELLEEKLRDAFFASIPAKQDRVTINLIRFETETEAKNAAVLLERGEGFDSLYARAMNGQITNAVGTPRDWSSRAELERDYGVPFAETALSLKTGECLRQPLAAAHGWYLFKLSAREIREMPEDWRRQRGLDAMQIWFTQQNHRIVQYRDWMNHVPPTPHIAYSRSGSELPPPPGGAGPGGGIKFPNTPSLGNKEPARPQAPLDPFGRSLSPRAGLAESHGTDRAANNLSSHLAPLQRPFSSATPDLNTSFPPSPSPVEGQQKAAAP